MSNNDQELYMVYAAHKSCGTDITVDIGTKDEIMNVLEDLYDISEEYQVYRLVPAFKVRLEKTARVIEEE